MTAPLTSLAGVLDQLAVANVELAEWHARETNVQSGRTYVAAGHRCIEAIDGALRELSAARALLVGEIRRDEDERAVRVDLMLAQYRAERAAREEPDRVGPYVPGLPRKVPPRFGEHGGEGTR